MPPHGRTKSKHGIHRLTAILGPGLITGAADDDPSGITTYSQAGAQFQYAFAWTAILQIPLMIAVQLMSARIGKLSGKNFATVLAEHVPRPVFWSACAMIVVANTFTAGADLAGVASGVEVLTGVPRWFVVPPVTIALVVVLVWGSYDLIRKLLKWLTLALGAYVVAGLLSGPQWGDLLRHTLIPTIQPTQDYVYMFVGVFGTTITPYLFVWQSAEEVAEDKAAGKETLEQRKGATPIELRDLDADTIVGMTVSQIIGYFIIVAAAAILFPRGVHDITSAAQAAQALHPIGQGIGTVLFALGLIGTGLLAVPTLTGSSAYMVAAAKRWTVGIERRPRQAVKYYVVLAVGTFIGGAIAMIPGSAMKLMVAAAVLNGLLAPPLLVLLLVIANDRQILGSHKNGWVLNTLGVIATAIMGLSALALAVMFVASHASRH